MLAPLEENAITETVIAKAIEIHRLLGPGLFEKTYEECLAYELRSEGLQVEQQKHLPLVYRNVELSDGYRIDIMVNDAVLVELKTVEVISALHTSQILTYLRLSDKRVGLILNFNSVTLRSGIKRVVNLHPKISAIPAPS
jgi:GxxExxY protein